MQKETISQIESKEKSSLENKLLGALWGAVLGDVIGAHLQFDKDITNTKIINAFEIKGGGKHNLEPGQPTDDSELNYSVCKGLIRGNGKLNLNFIAEQMGNWFLSKPIDIGGTIRNSVPKACNMKVHQAHLCRKGAKQRSQTSQSNGTLMALIGFALWCRKLSPLDIIKAVRQYTILIHPNEMVVLTNIFYTLLISHVLKENSNLQNLLEIYESAKKDLYSNKNQFDLKNFNQFGHWLAVIQKSFENFEHLQKQVPISKPSGWVRIAFSYSCYFLVKGTDFKKDIEYVIRKKGDTDTNACIIGGLIGARFGLSKLKMQKQVQKIGLWRPKTKTRPEWMIPGKVVSKIAAFIQSTSPSQLQMIGSESEYNKDKDQK